MLILQPGEQEHEFIAAEPGNRVTAAHTGFQTLGDFNQQTITGGVAVAVINRFEAVKIEIANGQYLAITFGLRHGQLHAVAKQHAVG